MRRSFEKPGRRGRAFTLVELLIVVAVIALLIGVLGPALGSAASAARETKCSSNLRQLGVAWAAYAVDYDGKAAPLAYTDMSIIGAGDGVYWFGTDGSRTGDVDYSRGILTPYLSAPAGRDSVFECPAQPWGSYAPQTRTGQPTTTYGYNGYYLCPPHTPGWGGAWGSIGHRPWQRLDAIARPTELLVFADALLPVGASGRSTSLLDPPLLYDGSGGWRVNEAPTTCFRHAGRAAAAHADGSVRSREPDRDAVFVERLGVGSVSASNAPHYVPDAAAW